MGQAYSDQGPPPSLEQLSSILADRFARQCYTPLELYCFKHVFSTLAESQSGVKYWSEATLCRFLELPDSLGVGSVIFQMASYLGAFPFPSQAPAILTNEALLKVVTLLTNRYATVLKKRGRKLWLSEIYRSLAVYDRGLQPSFDHNRNPSSPTTSTEAPAGSGGINNGVISGSDLGFAIDRPEDDEDEEEEDDELVLAALESMDATDVFKHGEKANMHHSVIPSDNFLKLLQFLLLIAPMHPQDSMSTYAAQLSDDRLRGLRKTASDILASFNIEKAHGINFRTFDTVVSTALPHLFDSLGPLFEHFLFAKDIDLAKRKDSASPSANPSPNFPPSPENIPPPEPVLRTEGELLDLNMLSQLSFIFKSPKLFRRLRPLYSGNNAGFSMGSFEKAVFKWNSPTILLVSGSIISDHPTNARERALADTLPHSSRLTSSIPHDSDQTLVYGAYIPTPWKQTHKVCFSDAETLLFQLSPVHDIFGASPHGTDYAYFNRSPTQPPGLGFGSSIPQTSKSVSNPLLRLGPVSLHLDDALEFGVFTHLSEGGGSFHTSLLPGRKYKNWQDRFEIESLEVWGIGGEEEAEIQRREWAWEEREAEARRRINLGTGDIEADKELLRMAGLIGGDRSGGSV